MDNKKNATAVLDKPKTSNTPSSLPQQQQKINPKEEAKTQLTEELIHSSEKRLQDALNKFKASESVRKEAHELSNDIAGRIRRISQTAKTEDAFRRDVDEFVSSAITYIINKARAENKKEKEKKENEEYKKKEEEKRKAKAIRKRNEEEAEQKKEETAEKPTEQQTENGQSPIISSTQSETSQQPPATVPPDTNQSTQKEEPTTQKIETTTVQQKQTEPTPQNIQVPISTSLNGDVSAQGTSNGDTHPVTPGPSVMQMTMPSNVIPPEHGNIIGKQNPISNQKSINPTTMKSIPQSSNGIISHPPVSTKSGTIPNQKNKAEVHMAIRHAIQQNAGLIKTKTTKEATNTNIHGGIIHHISNAGLMNTKITRAATNASMPRRVIQHVSSTGLIMNTVKKLPGFNAVNSGGEAGKPFVKKTSMPGITTVSNKKAIPLQNFHKIIQPAIGYTVTEEYPQEIEGNDRGAAIAGNPNTQTKTEYLGSSRSRGDENFSVRKYFPSSSNNDEEDGGGGGEGSRGKRKRRGIPGMGKGGSKVAQQAAKSLFQAAMRSPLFWGIVIAFVIILMLILIIIGIGGEKAKEDNKDTEAKLSLTKTGPQKAIKGQNMEYTITANYPAAAEDLTIVDKIPVGVKYVSSAPAGTYDAAARTVTWNAKALNVPLTNPVAMTVKVILQAETDNITAINIATGEVIPSDGSLLAVTKTGPPTATVGQNAEYTINATYQGAAEDITIVDKIPVGVKYVSSAPAGTYNATQRTVTWNAKQLKLALANPLNLSVKVTLLVEANDVALVNQATATVKANAGGAMNIPPSTNDCHGVYKSWMDQLKRVGKSNYGDPNCELVKQDPNGRWIIDKDKMLAGFKTIMPAKEAEGTWTCIVPNESGYNSNAWNPRSTSTARGTSGAYGNFQMNEAKYSNTGQPEDVGDVAWKQQAFNAYTWKNKYHNGTWRGYWPESYKGCLQKFGL